jgi:hypothetical protein
VATRVEEIADGDELYRRIAPGAIRPDGSMSRAAYMRNSQPDDEISVDLGRLTTPECSLEPVKGRGFGLGALLAGFPRSLGLAVRHDPLPTNRAHALIVGTTTRQTCRLLADQTRLVVTPAHA